jgi:glycosyltransferase involved in cell wall biosynthesis
MLQEERPDVVHGHNLFPMLSPAIVRAVRRAGVPFVLTLHNYRQMCLPATFLRDGRPCEVCLGHVPWRGVAYRCYRDSLPASAALASSLTLHRALGTFDRVTISLAVSRFILERHVRAGVPRDRIVCKPNFAWPSARREGPGGYFLYLGRLAPEKGLRSLVEAWSEVDAPLSIVGDGDLRSELEAAAPPTVTFLGTVSGERALELLRGARAMILPSIWYEGAPRSIAEACAAGVPVIASRIGSLPEFVDDGSTGRLFPAGDPAALARAAIELLDDSVSTRLGEGAYRLWEARFTPERGAEELEAAYAKAMRVSGSREDAVV